MSIQTEYYDPQTGIIHITDFHNGGSISAGGTEGRELGLQNTTFGDVKMKILSIDYKIQVFAGNASGGGDFNLTAWNPSYDAFGTVVFGCSNAVEDPADLTEVEDFKGTSGWPVHYDTWVTVPGRLASVSKKWKPRKLAFSNEQVATISVRNDSASSAAPYWFGSMYIRGVRL
jgi:hypothetical protein